MLSEQIAEYWASFKIKPDANSVRKLDQWLRVVEAKIQRTSRKLEKQDVMGGLFKVDNAKLAQQLNKSLQIASSKTVFNINNFRVNQAALNSAIQSAAARATTITISPRVGKVTGSSGSSPNQLTERPRGIGERIRTSNTRGLGMAWHGALAGGGLLSGFGLRELNSKLQELELQPVSMQAVTNGNQTKANSQLQFIRNLAGQVGTTTTNITPMYTRFFASAQGTPLEQYAQSGFASMTRYGAVMGLNQDEMKGSLRALQQIVGKQRLYSEELIGQLSERMPAAVRLMANAATGGDVPKLLEMMKRGEVDINKVLPRFFEEVEAQAAGGWDRYRQTTRYQQGQTSFQFEERLRQFGSEGGNQAFFRIWKTFADTLPQTNNLVNALAGAFQTFSRGVEGAGNIIVMLNDGLAQFNKLNPDVQDGLQTLGAAFLLLGTRIGRAFLPLTAAYLVLEDIAGYRSGKKSITGLALGEDYSGENNNAAPLGFALGNRYPDLPAGEALTRKWADAQTGSDWDKAKYMFSLVSAKTSIPSLLGGVKDMIIPPQSGQSLDAMINGFTGGNNVQTMFDRTSGKYDIDTVNIYPQNNKPEEFDFLMKRTLQNMAPQE